jgi:hypothetical protein
MAKKKRASKGKRAPRPRRVIIITLCPSSGPPRRRAEISWLKFRRFTLNDLAKHRDCGRWQLPIGWHIKIRNGEGE